MKNLQISPEFLKRFIQQFLPQGRISDSNSVELMPLCTTIQSVLGSIDLLASLDLIYDVFYNLHYQINVVEPLRKDRYCIPYIETNSHAIFIGIDTIAMQRMDMFVKMLQSQSLTMPDELMGMFAALEDFNSYTTAT